MGVCTFGAYKLIYMGVKSNAISTILSICVAVAVYGIILIKLGCLTEEELREMPAGTRLLVVFRKLHLM